jgi:hypothetical protein
LAGRLRRTIRSWKGEFGEVEKSGYGVLVEALDRRRYGVGI